jgi:hypothetical protein
MLDCVCSDTVFLENRRGFTPYWEYIKKGGTNKTGTKRGAEAQETKKTRAITTSALAIN